MQTTGVLSLVLATQLCLNLMPINDHSFFVVMKERGESVRESSAAVAARRGLTHGSSVDGLDLVFVLGFVPHERQPFQSCQCARQKTDRQTLERVTKQPRKRWRNIKNKRQEGRTDMMWLMLKTATGRETERVEPLDTHKLNNMSIQYTQTRTTTKKT